MEEDQQFCLRWNNHQSTLISVFDNLLASETLVDCTLAAEGKYLKAHKVVLSACSPYFANLLKEQYDKHPIFILKDVKYQELRYMMDYMYRGEVNISQDQLPALLKAAESLQIKGLSDNRPSVPNPEQQHQQQHQQHHQQQHQQHHRASLPTNIGPVAGIAPKYPGTNYTLEQTKRARMSGRTMGSIDTSELDSREGSSSPSRKLRKMRRKSNENATNDTHDNSNSSQLLQSNQQQQVANANIVAGLSGVGGISAVASALAASSAAVAVLHTGSSLAAAAVAPTSGGAGGGSSIKKTDSLKATSQTDAMNIIENSTPGGSNLTIVAAGSVANALSDIHHHHQYQTHHTDTTTGGDKIVLKQKLQQQQQPSSKDISANQSELVIEPKSEYDDDANDEAVEDLTLDEEDMGMEDLDQKAGPSQGGEGSSQGYAPWQQDQSQDELLLNTQEAQQRDPQDLRHNCPIKTLGGGNGTTAVISPTNELLLKDKQNAALLLNLKSIGQHDTRISKERYRPFNEVGNLANVTKERTELNVFNNAIRDIKRLTQNGLPELLTPTAVTTVTTVSVATTVTTATTVSVATSIGTTLTTIADATIGLTINNDIAKMKNGILSKNVSVGGLNLVAAKTNMSNNNNSNDNLVQTVPPKKRGKRKQNEAFVTRIPTEMNQPTSLFPNGMIFTTTNNNENSLPHSVAPPSSLSPAPTAAPGPAPAPAPLLLTQAHTMLMPSSVLNTMPSINNNSNSNSSSNSNSNSNSNSSSSSNNNNNNNDANTTNDFDNVISGVTSDVNNTATVIRNINNINININSNSNSNSSNSSSNSNNQNNNNMSNNNSHTPAIRPVPLSHLTNPQTVAFAAVLQKHLQAQEILRYQTDALLNNEQGSAIRQTAGKILESILLNQTQNHSQKSSYSENSSDENIDSPISNCNNSRTNDDHNDDNLNDDTNTYTQLANDDLQDITNFDDIRLMENAKTLPTITTNPICLLANAANINSINTNNSCINTNTNTNTNTNNTNNNNDNSNNSNNNNNNSDNNTNIVYTLANEPHKFINLGGQTPIGIPVSSFLDLSVNGLNNSINGTNCINNLNGLNGINGISGLNMPNTIADIKAKKRTDSQSDIHGELQRYVCNFCGKMYRWKSTLRRHVNVECGGKLPLNTCPYCPYKSKQAGNLGVHVRKHHPDKEPLASKRRSKYSRQSIHKINNHNSSNNNNLNSNNSNCNTNNKKTNRCRIF